MLANIFSSKEIVRIFDFLLDNPLSQFTKSDIANGSSVSRPTVSKIVPLLVKMGILERTRNFGITELFELNLSSPLVASLMKFDSELSKVFVDSNIDTLDPSPHIYDDLKIIYLFDRTPSNWTLVNKFELQSIYRQKVKKIAELEILTTPTPSSA